MNHLVWLNGMIVVGMAYADCEFSILLFDGATGFPPSIKDGKSPIGYEIIDLKGDTLHIQTILDNCAAEEDQRMFLAKNFL